MLEEIKTKLEEANSKLQQLRGYLDVDNKRQQIDALTLQMSQAGFWDNNEAASQVISKLKVLKASVTPWDEASLKYRDILEMAAILKEEERDMLFEIQTDLASLEKQLERLEFKTLLSGKFDPNNAILSINAGAGGTESCDWVSMLLRMYTRFAENKGYTVKTIDILYGEEAGIKNVTLFMEGEYAYGYLKCERGVHRLVRISPFDANKRRHTSFASVDVIPQIEGEIDIKIEEKDLRIDVFRSSGPGGQSVNTTDSAVRITHLPTGLVTQCQNERSQYQNKQNALSILKARLYELESSKKEEELASQSGDKRKIEWGSQIRSYVMHPYNLVKDHRTDFETGNVPAVMDGGLDEFIEAFLKKQAKG
ncbi:MAG: peptide chain release factor 2 [Candidatus Omnitrophica bacterium]|nr:peptide chain release factor 2 [Candidatus Omnitrophota bacterium]MDD5655282.1 peptide chain release factor 2 [Candidatus Omnitrophota bacterium]